MTVVRKRNNWYIDTSVTQIIIDSKTLLIRRYALKLLPSRRPYQIISWEYDSRGRIIYFSSRTRHRTHKWIRLTYTQDDNLDSYEDHMGDCWVRNWGTQFLFSQRMENFIRNILIMHGKINDDIKRFRKLYPDSVFPIELPLPKPLKKE